MSHEVKQFKSKIEIEKGLSENVSNLTTTRNKNFTSLKTFSRRYAYVGIGQSQKWSLRPRPSLVSAFFFRTLYQDL